MHRPPCDRNFALFAALLAAIGLRLSAPALAAPQDEVTRRDWGIGGFKPPPRWDIQPQDQPTYPQLLALASRGQGTERAVMTLVAKRLMPGTSVQSFANESAALQESAGVRELRRQAQVIDGWGGYRVQVDGVIEGARKKVVRQLFFVNATAGYVLTLVAPQTQSLPRLRDLEDTAANLLPLSLDAGARPVAPVPAQAPAPAQAPNVTPAPASESPR